MNNIMEKSRVFIALSVILSLSSACTVFRPHAEESALIIKTQGSFAVGGTQKREPGTFNLNDALKPAGQTYHGDHAYVFYQIPVRSKQYPLIFLHGAGQSRKTWETTPDGRDGFQNIFLRKGYGVYLLDQPRRAAAGRAMVAANLAPVADEQFWFTQFRIGNYPEYFPGAQFPKDTAALEQFYRQMTPNTGPFDANIISNAISDLLDKLGSGILVTHSQGGGPGWSTAIKNNKVKAIVAYEPYSGFVFPKGELPEPIKSTGLFGALNGSEIPLSDFMKLTKLPIVIYYGDNIAKAPTETWNKDHWRSGLEMAKRWAATINKHGGDAKVVHLPEVGIKGNTHFPFSDLNNMQVADLLADWLKEKGLNQ